MFKVIQTIFDTFWELFIVAVFIVSAQDIYRDIKKSALKQHSKGIPSLLKFNDHLWGRTK